MSANSRVQNGPAMTSVKSMTRKGRVPVCCANSFLLAVVGARGQVAARRSVVVMCQAAIMAREIMMRWIWLVPS